MDEEQKRILLISAGVVAIYALYVGLKRGSTAQQAQQQPSAPAGGGGGGGVSASDISGALQSITKGIQDSNAALVGVISQNNQANVSAISGLSDAFTKSIQAESQAFADEVTKLETQVSGITAQNVQLQNQQYTLLGQESIYSCIQPNGNIDATCVKVKGGPYSGTKTQNLGFLQNTYPSCRKNDGSFDLTCIGKSLAGTPAPAGA